MLLVGYLLKFLLISFSVLEQIKKLFILKTKLKAALIGGVNFIFHNSQYISKSNAVHQINNLLVLKSQSV